jgi:flavin-dependent dehydrogenase
LKAVYGPGWVAVGDAAASYDPLSSRGISKALESGLRAADAIAGCIKQRRNRWDDFAAWMAEDFKTYLRDYQHFYGQVTRWRDSRFWQRRVGSRLLGPSWGR